MLFRSSHRQVGREINRVQSADFMTVNEKRAAVGLSPVDGGDGL